MGERGWSAPFRRSELGDRGRFISDVDQQFNLNTNSTRPFSFTLADYNSIKSNSCNLRTTEPTYASRPRQLDPAFLAFCGSPSSDRVSDGTTNYVGEAPRQLTNSSERKVSMILSSKSRATASRTTGKSYDDTVVGAVLDRARRDSARPTPNSGRLDWPSRSARSGSK